MRGWVVACGALLLAACAGWPEMLTRPPEVAPTAPAAPRPPAPAPASPSAAPRSPAPAPEAPEPPAPTTAGRPPYLVLIPDSEVYHAPEHPVGLFFYNGLWYTRNAGRWFFSPDYTGPWKYLAPRGVPPAIQHLPGGPGAPPPPRRGPGGPG